MGSVAGGFTVTAGTSGWVLEKLVTDSYGVLSLRNAADGKSDRKKLRRSIAQKINPNA
jgi:hypothetical protein